MLLGLVPAAPSAAQDDCPALVEEALARAGAACGMLGRNQICYGYNMVEVTSWERAALDAFAAPGDVLDVARLSSLSTAPMDVNNGIWGVAVLALQADLPAALPGQNVTFIIFGDVKLESAGADPNYPTPMQAFYLTTGIGEPACKEAPRDGLLVQTPTGTTVHFMINGIEVGISSTAFIQSGAEIFSLSALDGSIEVTAQGETQTVVPGRRVDVPMHRVRAFGTTVRSVPDAPPAEPVFYDVDDVRGVPVNLLPEQVAVPAPAGVEVNVIGCELDEGGRTTVEAGQPLILEFGWYATTPDLVEQFTNTVARRLTYDGEPVEAWDVPAPELNEDGYFISWYFWVIPEPKPGEHEVMLSYDFLFPLTDGIDGDGDGEPDIYDGAEAWACTVRVLRAH
ncbi:MAG: hypothetical protein JXB47_10600 [Anaerolineae bacterium]|nr:hypothetical protein [Anaerolineae bacterium]